MRKLLTNSPALESQDVHERECTTTPFSFFTPFSKTESAPAHMIVYV